MSNMSYRAEIDGLRAVAVLPVVFFHAGFGWAEGGFVGVDIFFVISGYLITSILIAEMEKERFSLLDFYERRARRILPALFFVMILCLPISYLVMLPDPLENFGQSLFATTIFSNNYLLYFTSGYWDLSSEFKPLLHTWSLAVEEQFYLLYPLILMITWRFGKSVVLGGLIGLALTSLVFAVIQTDRDLAFYSIHTRAFELLLGALVCPYFFSVEMCTSSRKNVLSLIGMSMVMLSICFFDEATTLPGILSLAPVLGTCLMLVYGDKTTLVGKLLSQRYLVGLGLISYSSYLFHQPIFSYLRIINVSSPDDASYFIGILATFLFAHFSYSYIETPFRSRGKIQKQILWPLLGCVTVSLASVGLYLTAVNGAPERYSSLMTLNEKSRTLSNRIWDYSGVDGKGNHALNVLVIGNSFGRDVANVILETYDSSSYYLTYRHDLTTCDLGDENETNLFSSSSIIIFGSGYESKVCNQRISSYPELVAKTYYVGDKWFGENLNWIMRSDAGDRAFLRNPIDSNFIELDSAMRETLPEGKFISIYDILVNEDGILITDGVGMLLSDDRRHLTLSGARFIGEIVFRESALDGYFR